MSANDAIMDSIMPGIPPRIARFRATGGHRYIGLHNAIRNLEVRPGAVEGQTVASQREARRVSIDSYEDKNRVVG